MLAWLNPGQVDACALVDVATRYQRAVSSRSASLTAAEHYYRDLLVYQWRLDALDVQLAFVAGANRHDACIGDDIDDQLDWGISACIGVSRKSAVELSLIECLEDLDKQYSMAVAAIEERAEHYNFITIGSEAAGSGQPTRLATKPVERSDALEKFRLLARETLEEIRAEMTALSGVLSSGTVDLQQLRRSLERRKSFWQQELEETWQAWVDETGAAYKAGDDALRAWDDLNMDGERPRNIAVLQVMARVAAMCLETELRQPLGFCGLDSERFSLSMRIRALACVLEALREVGFLHEVGEALKMSESWTVLKGVALAKDADKAGLHALLLCVEVACCEREKDLDTCREQDKHAEEFNNSENDQEATPTANSNLVYIKTVVAQKVADVLLSLGHYTD